MPIDMSKGTTAIPNVLLDEHMKLLSDCGSRCYMMLAVNGPLNNASLVRLTGLSSQGVSNGLIELLSKGLSTHQKLSPIEAISLLSAKASYKIAGSMCACEWCGTQTIAIEKHHYPVPRREGGTDVVKICANCHQEFHLLVDYGLHSLTREALGYD